MYITFINDPCKSSTIYQVCLCITEFVGHNKGNLDNRLYVVSQMMVYKNQKPKEIFCSRIFTHLLSNHWGKKHWGEK